MRGTIPSACSLALLIALAVGQSMPPTNGGSARAVASRSQPLPTACPSTCVVAAQSDAHPSTLLSGETTTVSFQLRSVCAGAPVPMHIVLAVDSAQGISAREMATVQAELRKLVTRLDLAHNPYTRVAIVHQWQGEGRTLLPLVNDATAIERWVGRLESKGEPQPDRVLEEAHRALLRTRQEDCRHRDFDETVVLVTAEIDRDRCPMALRAARALEGDGIRRAVVNAAERPRDEGCLRQIASSARSYFHLRRLVGLSELFERIRDDGLYIGLQQLKLVERLNEGIDYVPDSASGEHARISVHGRTLIWHYDFIPRDGISPTYEVRLRLPGLKALSEGTQVIWRDTRNLDSSLQIEPTWAQVFAPARRAP